MKQVINDIEFLRIDSDVNGNPRYVCHYLNLLTDAEKENPPSFAGGSYDRAVTRAKAIGGKKYNNKKYGGGIVFQSHNLRETANQIVELTKNK